MPPQAPMPPVQAPMPPVPPPARTPILVPNPVNKFLIITIVLLVILFGAGGGYIYYSGYTQLAAANATLASTSAGLTKATQENTQMHQQVAQLTCTGAWSNNACTPSTLGAEPAAGKAPLKVTFTARVPNTGFSIEYGDGTGSWIAATPNAACVPDQSGLCTLTIVHTYAKAATSTATLMQASTTAASAVVGVTN